MVQARVERAVGAQQDVVAAVAVHHAARAREQRARRCRLRSTRTQRPTENGWLRSNIATVLPAVMKLSPTSCCRLADLARARSWSADPCRRRARALPRRRGSRTPGDRSASASARPAWAGSSDPASGARRPSPGPRTGSARSGRAAWPPRRAPHRPRPRASARSRRRRRPTPDSAPLRAPRCAPRAPQASRRLRASVTIAVGLGTPEYGIWPFSLTLLKKL